jgi:hypothetical protein
MQVQPGLVHPGSTAETGERKPQFLHFAAWFIILANFAWFNWRVPQSPFAPDEIVKMGWAWEAGPLRILSAVVAYFSPFYRPVGQLYYWVLFRVFGLNFVPFRIVDLCILLLNLWLAYSAFRRLSKSLPAIYIATFLFSYQAKVMIVLDYNGAFAFDRLCFTFFIAAFLAYIRVRSRQETLGLKSAGLVAFLYLFALGSKEMAVSLPFVLVAYELLFHPPRELLKSWRPLLFLFLMTVAYVFGKTYGQGALLDSDGYQLHPITLNHYLTSQAAYLEAFLMKPYHLTQLQIAVLTVAASLWAAALRSRTLGVALAWMLLTPLSIVFVDRGGLSLYIPLVGWCLFAAESTIRLAQLAAGRLGSGRYKLTVRLIVHVVLAGALLFIMFQRNRRTQDRELKFTLNNGNLTQHVVQEFNRVRPRIRPGDTAYVTNSPFAGYDVTFITELWADVKPLRVVEAGKPNPTQAEMPPETNLVLAFDSGNNLTATTRELAAPVSPSRPSHQNLPLNSTRVASLAVLRILLGALACAVTSLAVGLGFIRVLRMSLNRVESICLGYTLGAASVSMMTLGLGFVSSARGEVFYVLSVAALVLLWRLLPWLRAREHANLSSIPRPFRIVFVATWLVWGTMYFRYALLPETSPDAVTYHLGFVNIWNHAHRIFRIEDMYAAMPQGIEMLYLFAFSIGRHSSASLIHFSMLMLLPLSMILYGVRFGFPRTVLFAAVLVFVTPVVGWDGSIAYNDVALAVFVFATVYLLQIWRVHKQLPYLLAASFLAGFSFAIKYTGCFVSLLVVGVVMWELRREARARLSRAVLITVAAIAIAPTPYLIRNWIWFQNPVAFFGNSIFPNPYFHVAFEKGYIQAQAHVGGVEWKDLPRELTIGGPKLPESLGLVYLLAPLALIGLIWAPSRYLMISAFVVGLCYAGNKSARFLIPVLPPLALASAYVLNRLSPRLAASLTGLLTVCQLVLCWPALIEIIQMPKKPGYRLDDVPWDVALRQVPEERFIDQFVGEYEMARYVDAHVPEGQAVYAFKGGVAQAYTTHFIIDNFRSGLAENFQDLLLTYASSATAGGRQWTAVFPPARVQQLRIVQNGRSEHDWLISELRFWHGAELVTPSPGWRANADPNPWDIRDALDGNDATRWSSLAPTAPGMHIQVWPDGAPIIDRIDVCSPNRQPSSNMDVQIQSDGKWIHPRSTDWQAVPPIDRRKAVMQNLKKHGVRYFVIEHSDDTEGMFGKDPSAWGMREIASLRNSTLYFIE